MKNIREYEFWSNDYFSLNTHPGNSLSEKVGFSIVSMFFWSAATTIAIGIPLDIFFVSDTVAILSTGLVGAVLGLIAVSMGKFYKGHSLPTSAFDYYHRSDNNWNFPLRASEYFSLPREDRALYPSDIFEVMRDPDLTSRQKHELNENLKALYDGIQAREKQKRLASKRTVDVDGVIEHINTSRESVNIETTTYKELA